MNQDPEVGVPLKFKRFAVFDGGTMVVRVALVSVTAVGW
jgi:hypothetical protein